jgi:hypothetical protein
VGGNTRGGSTPLSRISCRSGNYLDAGDSKTRRCGGAAEVAVPGDYDHFLLAESKGGGQVDRVVAPEPE